MNLSLVGSSLILVSIPLSSSSLPPMPLLRCTSPKGEDRTTLLELSLNLQVTLLKFVFQLKLTCLLNGDMLKRDGKEEIWALQQSLKRRAFSSTDAAGEEIESRLKRNSDLQTQLRSKEEVEITMLKEALLMEREGRAQKDALEESRLNYSDLESKEKEIEEMRKRLGLAYNERDNLKNQSCDIKESSKAREECLENEKEINSALRDEAIVKDQRLKLNEKELEDLREQLRKKGNEFETKEEALRIEREANSNLKKESLRPTEKRVSRALRETL